MFFGESSIANRRQVHARQPSQLAVEQHGGRHLNVADHGPQCRRQSQGIDHGLHHESRLARSRRTAEQRHQPRPDFEARQLALANGIERRRLARQHVIPPAVQHVGGGEEVWFAQDTFPLCE